MRWNCISKALRFLQITAEHQDCPVFTVFIATKRHPKISRSRSYRFRLNFTNTEAVFGGKSSNFGDFDHEKPHRATLSGFIHGMVVVLRVRRRLRVVWSAMDTLAALQPSLESQSLEQVGYWNSVLGFQQRMSWGVLHRLPWIFGFITNLEIKWCSLVSSTFPFAPLTTHLKPYCLISRLPINFHKWEYYYTYLP